MTVVLDELRSRAKSLKCLEQAARLPAKASGFPEPRPNRALSKEEVQNGNAEGGEPSKLLGLRDLRTRLLFLQRA